MTKFVGRTEELNELKGLMRKSTASMVILKGRRRIGKSRLIEELAIGETFYVISGIPPTPETTIQSQLDEFSRQLAEQTGLPEVFADDWSKLFTLLAEATKKGRIIILLDEISWMGSKDPDFLGKLKNAWDLKFKKNPKLMLVICGSVSSWIEKNIVNSTGYLGRPSLYITLDELSLEECNQFWNKQGKNIAAFEKFKILSVTGGIPRYLELIDPTLPAEENIRRLCFSKHGPLVNEFEHIFSDIFAKRSGIYRQIVEHLVDGTATADELADAVGLTRTGLFDGYLEDLILSGFIARDYTWHLSTGQPAKLSHYRLKDNYIRFYLKYILTNKPKIDKNRFNTTKLYSLPGWETIVGLQFENLILNNHMLITNALHIQPNEVILDGPYFQRATKQQRGCQIDYLIQTRFDTLYVCEVKFSKHPIGTEIIQEMQEKLDRLKVPRHMSRRPVLIHVNGVTEDLQDQNYFSEVIDFSRYLIT